MRFVLLVALTACVALAQDRHSYIEIQLASHEHAEDLRAHGLALDDGVTPTPGGIRMWASEREQRRLREAGIRFEQLISDWDALYLQRSRDDKRHSPQGFPPSPVAHFHPGSMGGFLTLSEVFEEFDAMRAFAPHLITANDTLGTTVEGRPIIAVRITASKAAHPPSVLYNALTHAREPMGMMALVYFMWYCLEQYGQNLEITRLLDGAALHFIPVVNPDGYAYNQSTHPSGGGMWRKNRRPAPSDSIGVDLNRNWGYEWGANGIPANPDPRSEVYSGPTPFSEPETDALRKYCDTHDFRAAMNYHTFGDILIFPWGYADIEPRDSLAFRRSARRITAQNRYTWGTSVNTVLYPTNGDAATWMYGDTAQHPPVLAFIPEVGNAEDTFWPKSSRIPSLAAANLDANIQLAHEALPFLSLDTAWVEEDGAGFDVYLRVAGESAAAIIEAVEVSTTSSAVARSSASARLIPFPSASPIRMRFEKNISTPDPSQRLRFNVSIVSAESVMRDSIIVYPGAATTLLDDNVEADRGLWLYTGAWNRESCGGGRAGLCYSDSPGGTYPIDASSYMRLRTALDLSSYTSAMLRFTTRWHIQSRGDFGFVEASSDGGATWSALAGRTTSFGFGGAKQVPIGVSGFDGKHTDWVRELMDLTPFCGEKSVELRFRLEGTECEKCDGWFLDSILVTAFRPSVAGDDAVPTRLQYMVSEAAPNPCIGESVLSYFLPERASVHLCISDALGRVQHMEDLGVHNTGAYYTSVLSDLPAGIYYAVFDMIPSLSQNTAQRHVRRITKVR